jgi:hypothetical protein
MEKLEALNTKSELKKKAANIPLKKLSTTNSVL